MIRCNLKSVLDNKKISINKLSSATGISRQSITALVNNDSKGIQFNTLDRIVDFLNIRVEDIIEYTDNFKKLYVELNVPTQNDDKEFIVSVLPSGILDRYYGSFILEDTTESKLYSCSFSLHSTHVGASLNTYTTCSLDRSDEKDPNFNYIYKNRDVEYNPEKIDQFLSVLPNLDELSHSILTELIKYSFNEYERFSNNIGIKTRQYKTEKDGIFSLEFSLLNSKKNPVFSFETKFDNYIHLEPSSFKNNDNVSILLNEL